MGKAQGGAARPVVLQGGREGECGGASAAKPGESGGQRAGHQDSALRQRTGPELPLAFLTR